MSDSIGALGSQEARLSIALVTRNRPDWLRKCLASWRSQVPQPFEIVISDDSDAAIEPEVQSIAREYDCRWIRGPKRGLYANRNQVAVSCTGTHIMSADDDHTHPPGFIAAVMTSIAEDPERIWIFSERSPARPDIPLRCPPELRPNGTVGTPQNPSDCAAIACGSSVYPRRVFELGLRCDESYPFGAIWYLWGRILKRAGFHITYSDLSFVWHNMDSSKDRAHDMQWFRSQLECSLYVGAVNALRLNRNLPAIARLVKAALSYAWPGAMVQNAPGRVRIGPRALVRAVARAWQTPALPL